MMIYEIPEEYLKEEKLKVYATGSVSMHSQITEALVKGWFFIRQYENRKQARNGAQYVRDRFKTIHEQKSLEDLKSGLWGILDEKGYKIGYKDNFLIVKGLRYAKI